GATVYVGADMPGMAMGLRPVKANEVEPGRYQATVPLSMEGLWKLTVEVDGPEGKSSQQVSVVVKRGGGFPWVWVLVVAAVVALVAWRPPLWQGLIVGALVLLAVLAGKYLERYRPADKSMGMKMDMAAPDMGMNISEMQAPVPVVIEPVERDTVAMTVNYTGTVKPYLEETIYPRVEGWLLELPFYPGDQVKKGQVVGRLDDRELSLKAQKAEASAAVSKAKAREAAAQVAGSRQGIEMARAELEASKKRAERAQAEIHRTEVDLEYWDGVLRREKELLDAEAVSREEYEEKESRFATAKVMHHHARVDLERAEAEVKAHQAGLEQAKSQAEAAGLGATAAAAQERQARLEAAERETVADYTTLRAGIDGVVTERITDPGGLVRPGTGILKVADLDQVRLQFSVAEEDLPYIHQGTVVTVTSQALRGELEAEVTSMFRAVDARSRTGLVEALVKNPRRRLLPGSYVVGVFALRRERHVPTIPRGALASYYGEPSVWVAVERAGQLVAERRQLKLGAESEEQLEVLDGLEPGDQVIVAGHQGLVEGQPVVKAERGEGIYRNLLLPEAPR
ncbi:MAG: efflux RND transporter periplasmic adaptor subunit, partial [Candidatus Eremiobacteraeota bacterium]|nr:efflux RND transporter periplasmic adaptor subunit [Candidatus Eremiobacteraeota bacterium]